MITILSFLLLFISISIGLINIIHIVQNQTHFSENLIKAQLEEDLDQLSIEKSAKDVLKIALITSLFFSIVIFLIIKSIIIAIIVFVLSIYLMRFSINISKKKRIDKIGNQLADALDLIVNGLKAGMSIPQTFKLVSKEMPVPISREFTIISKEMDLGLTLVESLVHLESRVDNSEISLLVKSTQLTMETGGDIIEVYNNISDTVRQRINIADKVKTLASEGTFQAITVGIMPFVIFFLMFLMDPSLVAPMLETTQGHFIFGLVILLEAIGFIMMKKMLKIEY